jgi:hypothetical protein
MLGKIAGTAGPRLARLAAVAAAGCYLIVFIDF